MIALLAAAVVDVTVVLAAALAASAILRRRSAALRHAVLAAALVAALAVPAFELALPVWPVAIPVESAAVDTSGLRLTSAAAPTAIESDAGPAPAAWSWTDVAIGVWALGAAIVFAGLLTGVARLARATRRCGVITSGPWHDIAAALAARAGVRRNVQLRQSADAALLLTWGLFRPQIVLPAGAAAWTRERREIVLAHEFAHIARGDWAVQLMAEGLRALHWFNPLAWIACHRLRHESEYACDDAVLDGGVDPTDYASHLLEVARHAVGHGVWASAPAVANPSTLERRISAMLSHQEHRTPLTRRAAVLAAAAVTLLTMPVAAVTITTVAAPVPAGAAQIADVALIVEAPPTAPAAAAARPAAARAAAPAAQQTPASVSGTMIDQSGAVLPGVEMQLTDSELGVRYTAVSDGMGSFNFRDLQPGRYELVARLPGFAPVSNVFRLDAAASVQRRLTMPLGTVEENIRVGCSPGAAALGTGALRTVAFGARTGSTLSLIRGTDANPGVFSPGRWVRVAPPAPSTVALQGRGRGAAPAGADANEPLPVRVGGQIKAPRKLKDAYPICPRTVLPAGDTTITLVGRIGVDGFMNEVRFVEPKNGDPVPPTEFIEAALDATRQWVFSPTLLNNSPIETNITITVLYRRM